MHYELYELNCMKSMLNYTVSQNFGFLHRNRLACMKVPPGGTPVLSQFLGSALSCLAAR